MQINTSSGMLRPDVISGSMGLENVSSRINQTSRPATELSGENAALLKASQDFESFFVYMMLKEMRKTVPESKFIHGGRAEEIFRDMLDEETSKKIASAGQGIGIASMMYQQLARPQANETLENLINPGVAPLSLPSRKAK